MNRIRRWWVLNSAKKSIKKYKKSKFPTTSWPNSMQSRSVVDLSLGMQISETRFLMRHMLLLSFVFEWVLEDVLSYLGYIFFETVFTSNYHQSKKASSVTILVFPQVTNKTINTKARFLRLGYLTWTLMVTSQLTREAQRERHSMVRIRRESSYSSRQLIPILLRIIIQWRLAITFTFVKFIFRSGTTQSPSSAVR